MFVIAVKDVGGKVQTEGWKDQGGIASGSRPYRKTLAGVSACDDKND